jgi:cell division protein FtsB
VFYGILASLLLAFGIHYKHLETQVHEVKQVAAAAQTQVKAVDKTAETTETQSALIYKEIVRIPDVPDIGIVCRNTRSSPLPAPDTKPGAAVGDKPADSAVGPGYDPSGAALARAKAADAQIAYLQRRVHELETQMNNSP